MKKNWLVRLIKLSSPCAAAFLLGCKNMVLLNPKGPIGDGERFVILAAIALMLIVVVPVIVMTFWFARRYRASNTDAVFRPKWSASVKIDLIVWLVPVAIVTVLAFVAWTRTHRLDPYEPIEPGIKPILIEAISLDWKWLFIYPEQNLASINQFVFPANVPVSFRITSDSVLTSFFIPQLGSQIYAMAGRETRLHLLAEVPGTYDGHNQQFSGRGYSDMHFEAIATSDAQFAAWVQKVKQSTEKLDLARFDKLARPSVDCPVITFSSVKPDLFELIVRKYRLDGINPEARARIPDSGS
jgi:cytochrome o ubiquinol oxidase subunit II